MSWPRSAALSRLTVTEPAACCIAVTRGTRQTPPCCTDSTPGVVTGRLFVWDAKAHPSRDECCSDTNKYPSRDECCSDTNKYPSRDECCSDTIKYQSRDDCCSDINAHPSRNECCSGTLTHIRHICHRTSVVVNQ